MGKLLIQNIHSAFLNAPDAVVARNIDIAIENTDITAVGPNLPAGGFEILDATACVVIPGLVNTHHHFYQTLTRTIPRMQNAGLFNWLTHHYRIWEGIDAESVYHGSLAAIAELLLTGCTLTTDHHYLFPDSAPGNLLDIQIQAAREMGIRFIATRGSMSLGKSKGGLPPDSLVQTESEIIRDSRRVIEKFHDPGPRSMQRIALAPCSPFSVSERLMTETRDLARSYGVRLHTHLAETRDEEKYCLKRFGCRPVKLMQNLGWLGPDVWFAHCVHLNPDEIELFGRTGTGVAHCPSSNMRLGSGVAPVAELLAAGAPVGLAVDGPASNDTSDMLGEIRQCLYLQRVFKGPAVMNVWQALTLATSGGARMLGFDDFGVLAPGYPADIALFRIDSVDYAGVHDPVAGLIFAGSSHRAHAVIVQGRIVVRNGRLANGRESSILENANRLGADLLRKASTRTGIDYLRHVSNDSAEGFTGAGPGLIQSDRTESPGP
ncbi:8-oxoguanine deaminase [bacterium]|nr:8-oxoguanine deaminase [candidate division CSSED10-310 bacterium]